jgi:Tol biopolymer transport system component
MRSISLLGVAGGLLCNPLPAGDATTGAKQPAVTSVLETIDIRTGRRTTIYRARGRFEAPNWSRDGRELIFNQAGSLFRIAVEGGKPSRIDTGFAIHCNNDHGISPCGRSLVISDSTRPGGSQIYTLPITGGTPQPVTRPGAGSAYWHGWSPDGRTLAFVSGRDGNIDIYAIPASGGTSVRLTTDPGQDDGPDYSPDGRHIHYNSFRSGSMQLWRMDADGSNPVQLTSDAHSNWFPHPSPDGRWISFLSYVEDQGASHPANKDVMLRLMPAEGGMPRVLARFIGGQGTINVPSWSPDSRRFAFVSYVIESEAR